jgi:hypothetical protein
MSLNPLYHPVSPPPSKNRSIWYDMKGFFLGGGGVKILTFRRRRNHTAGAGHNVGLREVQVA